MYTLPFILSYSEPRVCTFHKHSSLVDKSYPEITIIFHRRRRKFQYTHTHTHTHIYIHNIFYIYIFLYIHNAAMVESRYSFSETHFHYKIAETIYPTFDFLHFRTYLRVHYLTHTIQL